MKRKLFVLLLLTILALSVGALVSAAETMKPHHGSNGLACDDCHSGNQNEPAGMEQCLNCHELPEQKEDYHGAADEHDSPHYGPELECENCHHEHQASENFCNSCHDFDFKTP